MRDEIHQLCEDAHLVQLLQIYCLNSSEDRDAWLDRCMALEGVEPVQLRQLHGFLIAFGWLEQNSGQVPVAKPDACPQCYRTTAAGRRALKQHRSRDEDADNLAAAA